MHPSIEIKVSDSAAEIIARVTDSAGLLQSIAKELDIQTHENIRHISTVRMRGNNNKPFPPSEHKLGIRTAQLSKSLRASPAQISGETVTASIGTNLRYAGIHEFGGTIKRVLLAGSVRLATDRQGNLLRQKDGKLAVFARAKRKNATTVAYAGGKRFEVTVPARAPIQHGIRDRANATGSAISRAIINHLKGKS